MERTLIADIKNYIDQAVLIKGRILSSRQLGPITFIQVRDYTGTVQVVLNDAANVRAGDIVAVSGKVIKEERAKSGVEIHGTTCEVIATSVDEWPFDITKKELNLQLATLLDQRTLAVRHPKIVAIFKLYDLLLKYYESVMREEGFVEVKTPKILEAASEGGANFFKLKYFERDAFLAQSPQLYKQILTGAFERVFEVGPVFRAEPHFTTRHINEYISLDAEMGMIDSFYDVIHMLNKIIKKVFEGMRSEGAEYLEVYKTTINDVPEKIPCLKLSEVLDILRKRYKYNNPDENDIDPEGERLACRFAQEEYQSDFIFITHYPWSAKPFYTMPDPANPQETLSFDLLYKGVEISSGGQRIHTYDQLLKNIEAKGMTTKGLEFYLDTFKYAMAPHGGWGLGSERIVQLILNLGSIKEATLFPRDVKRLNP
ncbi:TPA: aspartate--tRNA(Asn) ligase [Candidatus Dependentiae bacterium]|nr:MAG: Aspartyl-tRNA synthetase [candidate division TM6 bacterium GW2011_GWF2_36_131]KKQ02766.1 MAG: Aspartyl-tRNA synthetase [candidate division TM6 bacterium GW2011_GWE2_36_25]KKQ19137.1 MAG: Aspartyl-tRNA synthetase [candidate division TM6 bacterium GW2011_GWA2_36_9]HBR70418.1 aspartate--tRNA(Asn) ligase [Candidatus Dependentiae bacterium]HCU01145.1 aspartate--tRNA(Asn) ligase [Candidatus Dependentiae bacterium]